jgi:hypothetical protein
MKQVVPLLIDRALIALDKAGGGRRGPRRGQSLSANPIVGAPLNAQSLTISMYGGFVGNHLIKKIEASFPFSIFTTTLFRGKERRIRGYV